MDALSPRCIRFVAGAAGAWHRVTLRLIATAVFGSFSALLAATPSFAADAAPIERTVKAAFVYKFLGYIEWPAEAFAQTDAPIVIGVFGADDIAAELAQILPGRSVADRPVEVKRLKDGDSLAGLHVLFVGHVERAKIGQLARSAQQQSILTITESEGSLASGSIINLVVADGRVRFEVALDTAEKSHLKLSSRLLALAVAVRGGA